MRHELATLFFAGSSEAEALNFAAEYLETPHRLISAWRDAGKSGDDLYAEIWTRRGAIQRLLSTRRKLLEKSTADSVVERYERYLEVRYEDLVSETRRDATCSGLLSYLGVSDRILSTNLVRTPKTLILYP